MQSSLTFSWSGRRDSNPRPSPWQGDRKSALSREQRKRCARARARTHCGALPAKVDWQIHWRAGVPTSVGTFIQRCQQSKASTVHPVSTRRTRLSRNWRSHTGTGLRFAEVSIFDPTAWRRRSSSRLRGPGIVGQLDEADDLVGRADHGRGGAGHASGSSSCAHRSGRGPLATFGLSASRPSSMPRQYRGSSSRTGSSAPRPSKLASRCAVSASQTR